VSGSFLAWGENATVAFHWLGKRYGPVKQISPVQWHEPPAGTHVPGDAVPMPQRSPEPAGDAIPWHGIVAGVVVATSLASRDRPIRNPTGDVLSPVRQGSGIAGARYDVLSGRITLGQLCAMSCSVLAKRYQCSRSQASRLRAYLYSYGVDGRYRYLDGTPRSRSPAGDTSC
jgi:hypothetical protein